MTDELEWPKESISTLGVQFTRATLKKVDKAVKKLQGQGWSEARILKRMRAELSAFRPFAIQRLYEKAVGRTIPDDFGDGDLASEKEVKPGTLEIELKNPPAHIEIECLVQFRGKDWYVTSIRGKTYTLKLLT